MKKDLDESLSKRFPNLYRDRYGDKSKTGMCWGFTCGNGWYPLVRRLSAKLEKLILEIPENKRKFYKASQVKQKFGALRVYMHDMTKEMRAAIEEAVEESKHTCEACGREGALVKQDRGWIRVSCKEHVDNAHWRSMEEVGIHWTVKLSDMLHALLYR